MPQVPDSREASPYLVYLDLSLEFLEASLEEVLALALLVEVHLPCKVFSLLCYQLL